MALPSLNAQPLVTPESRDCGTRRINSPSLIHQRPTGPPSDGLVPWRARGHRLTLFFFREKKVGELGTPGHTRQLSTGKRRRKNYVSLTLVHCCWVDRGRYREIGDARAHDDFLDNRARHHWIDHRRSRYPHLLPPFKRTISSRRSHFFHPRRDSDSLHLL